MTLPCPRGLLAIACGVLLLADAAAGAQDLAGDPKRPLRPPDTSSPRATLGSFLADANASWHAYLEPGGAGREAWRRRIGRAARCFDLSETPPTGWEAFSASNVTSLRLGDPLLECLPDLSMPKLRRLDLSWNGHLQDLRGDLR